MVVHVMKWYDILEDMKNMELDYDALNHGVMSKSLYECIILVPYTHGIYSHQVIHLYLKVTNYYKYIVLQLNYLEF